jgi:acetyl esterase
MPSPSLRRRFQAAHVHLRVAAADRAIHTAAKIRSTWHDASLARNHIAVVKDIPYRPTGSAAHTLDVYIPTRAAKPLPTILYVHGGGFAMLSKETHRLMALAYARRGYLVFCINYRLGPKFLYPAPLEDAVHALVWARDHAESYGGDPNNLAIAGESAGGNLVTALTVASSIRRPEPYARHLFDADVRLRATVATYGFLDLEGIDHYEKHPRLSRSLKDLVFHAAASYVGLDVERGCAEAPLASPLLVLERAEGLDRPLPAVFADVGTRDPLLGDSRRLNAAVERHGGACTLHIAPGEIHGYDALVWRSAAREKWHRVHDFLTPHMVRAPEPLRSGIVPACDDETERAMGSWEPLKAVGERRGRGR